MNGSPDFTFFWVAFWCYLGATAGAAVYSGMRRPKIRTFVLLATIAGLAANTVALVVRSVLSGHPPVTNLFEYLSFFSWAIVVGFLILWRRKGLELVTVFAGAVAFPMMVIASLFPSQIEQQLMPALQSYWLWVHVSLAVLAEAAFAVAFVASLFYLGGARTGFRTGPGADALDAVTYRAIGIGFPLFTIGALFAGAVWAQRAWGSPWSWDPKETSSLIVWLIYAIYLHARLVRGMRGTGVATLSVVGFAMTVLTILGSRILGGLHSYG